MSAKNTKHVWAAGGVLWRPGPGGAIELGLVHRPRYDDWTLPKGKQDAGETLIGTAVREIAEETGHRVRLGRHLTDVAYDLDQSRKHVRYWSARAVGGTFEANHEVDDLRWLAAAEAIETLSYRLDQRIVREFVRLPARLHTLLLVRHARAGRRSRYKGDDRLRPLDTLGREQARAMTPLLQAFGATDLHSADRVRCQQTLEPFATHLGTSIAVEPTMSEEAYRDDAAAAHDRIRRIATDDQRIHAVCSQGKVIPPLMQWWAGQDEYTLPASRNRKGSVWVVSLCEGRVVAADHIASPLPAAD